MSAATQARLTAAVRLAGGLGILGGGYGEKAWPKHELAALAHLLKPASGLVSSLERSSLGCRISHSRLDGVRLCCPSEIPLDSYALQAGWDKEGSGSIKEGSGGISGSNDGTAESSRASCGRDAIHAWRSRSVPALRARQAFRGLAPTSAAMWCVWARLRLCRSCRRPGLLRPMGRMSAGDGVRAMD